MRMYVVLKGIGNPFADVMALHFVSLSREVSGRKLLNTNHSSFCDGQ